MEGVILVVVVVNWGLGVVEKGCSGERRNGVVIKGRMEGRRRRVQRRAAILYVIGLICEVLNALLYSYSWKNSACL